jgi:two-component system NtrC family sensor kinase
LSIQKDPEQIVLPPPAERESQPAPSGQRPSLDPGAAPPWLQELLDLSLALPCDEGLLAVVKPAVDCTARLLPGCAVGACVTDELGGAPIVEYRLPPGEGPELGHDPARLFPRFSHEIVSELDNTGSTFHVASQRAPLEPGSRDRAVTQRAARVVAAAIERARAFQRVRESRHDLQKLQAQVIQAEKLASLGQIVAGVVHELNNPLTSIVAYSDYLKKKAVKQQADQRDIDDTVERLRRIGEAAERILKFSRDLVAYARPSADIPGPVALQEVIDKALVFCEHEFSESKVAVKREVVDYVPPVRGIAGQLTQVFVNLFTNAAHAMFGRGGELRIKMSVADCCDTLLVEVEDDGCGIAAEDMEQIFEPFFSTKTDGRGTGLGLSIVRDIVNAHGGSLSAKSAPGAGSVFSLKLPLAALPPSLMPPPKGGRQQSRE